LRYTTTGNVFARACLEKDAPPLYDYIKIKLPLNEKSLYFCLKMPDGQIVERTSMTCDGLQKAGFIDIYRGYTAGYFDENTKKTLDVSHELESHGATFLFVGDTLMEIRLYSRDVDGVAIGQKDMEKFYTLPLTQEALESIFGKPDKITDGTCW